MINCYKLDNSLKEKHSHLKSRNKLMNKINKDLKFKHENKFNTTNFPIFYFLYLFV